MQPGNDGDNRTDEHDKHLEMFSNSHHRKEFGVYGMDR